MNVQLPTLHRTMLETTPQNIAIWLMRAATELLQIFVTIHTNTLEELGKIINRPTLLEVQLSEIASNQPVCDRTPVTHMSV